MLSSPRSSSVSRFGAAGLVLLLLLAVPGQVRAAGRPAFDSTFVQLWDRHDQWTHSQWDTLCGDLAGLGIHEIILQWTLRTEPAFSWRLTPERRASVPDDRVEPAPAVARVFEAARRHGLRVRFGLTDDPAWWEEIRNNASLVEVFLNRLYQDQTSLAQTLTERFGGDRAFAGFYIPQEIDDSSWIDPARRARLREHLQRLGAALQQMRPRTSLAISAFATGQNDPRSFAQFMTDLAKAGSIDQILYQDSIGTGRLQLDESALYLRALTAAAGNAPAIRPVVEIFAPGQQSGSFEPAPINRIERQLLQAGQLGGPDIIAFSLPDYAHPAVGPDQAVLFEAYRAYLRN